MNNTLEKAMMTMGIVKYIITTIIMSTLLVMTSIIITTTIITITGNGINEYQRKL